jgi:hypothetical protein
LEKACDIQQASELDLALDLGKSPSVGDRYPGTAVQP